MFNLKYKKLSISKGNELVVNWAAGQFPTFDSCLSKLTASQSHLIPRQVDFFDLLCQFWTFGSCLLEMFALLSHLIHWQVKKFLLCFTDAFTTAVCLVKCCAGRGMMIHNLRSCLDQIWTSREMHGRCFWCPEVTAIGLQGESSDVLSSVLPDGSLSQRDVIVTHPVARLPQKRVVNAPWHHLLEYSWSR